MYTRKNLRSTPFYFQVFLLVLLFGIVPTSTDAQTIDDVFPRRVTEGSRITIEGSGFNQTIANSIRFLNGGMNAQNKSASADGRRMFFTIGRNDVTTNTPVTADAPEDITRQLQVNFGSGLINVEISNQPVNITYIAPFAMIHAVAPYTENGRIRVANRVEEIYTDYGGLKTYQDGDEFTRGSDINSQTYGRWEFFGLVFPANPSGILVETGGRGRGMFIGFNDAGDFVARGGDGRSLAPAGCARLVLDPSTFAGKTGRLLVTMEPSTGEMYVEWDEFDDNSPDYTNTVTAADGFLGYGTLIEWSGGNAGRVGDKPDGSPNIAGSEITNLTGNYNFNGTIGSMTFSNFEDTPIAWRSNWGTYSNDPSPPPNPVIPDNYHDLLGFKYNGIVYATGANNALLEEFLGSEIVDGSGDPIIGQYDRTRFKAYSTNGVQNTTVAQHHIFTGEFVDGKELETPTEFLSIVDPNDPDYEPAFENIRGLSMFDVLVDGKNGLNIGSGINNLNRSTSIQFFSGNGQVGNAGDGIPDLLIPNMAEAGGTDVYYYSDELGNIIGRPISIRINNSDINNPPLSHWQNDQYRVTHPGVSFNAAVPETRIYGNAQERPMRLIAFNLSDFGIGDGGNQFWNLASIENINAGAGGTADIPFLAYNGDTFQIRSPEVRVLPKGRSICEVPSDIDVTFTVEANVDGGFSLGNPTELAKEKLTFEWFRYNNLTQTNADVNPGTGPDNNAVSSLTVNNVNVAKLGLYRIRISNFYGTTIVTVPIEEGGIPAIWDGTNWRFPSGFVAEGTPIPPADTETKEVADADRRLIWQESYNINNEEILGCDCVIPAGSVVQITNEGVLDLYGKLTLNPEEPAVDEDGNLDPNGTPTPAGQLIIEDGSSLLQRKDADSNANIGEIAMDRRATQMSDLDYIYWSSPVEAFEINGGIPNSASFMWDVRAANTTGTDGNWLPYDGEMELGKGYIARVPFGVVNPPYNSDVLTKFIGRPNNGLVDIEVRKSGGTQALEDKHWNLLGNPYPSAMSATKFLLHNTMLEGAVYIWDSNGSTFSNANPAPWYENFLVNYSNSYITNNLLGTVPDVSDDSFNGNIAAGQGFFVKVLESANATENVEFRNPMRYSASDNVLPNNEFFRSVQNATSTSSDEEKQLIWLFLANESGQSASALVGYAAGATNGKDRLYDAFISASDGELSLHSFVENNKMVIQGRSLPFDELDTVDLGVHIPESGIYSIGIDNLKGSILRDQETNVVLEDTYNGTLHNLKEAPYTFNIEQGTYNDRFILRYNANQLSTKDAETPDTFAYIKDRRLHIQSEGRISKVQVYDLSGKLVMDYKPESNMTRIETDFNFARGAYITLITLDGDIQVSKKLMN